MDCTRIEQGLNCFLFFLVDLFDFDFVGVIVRGQN